MKLLKEMKGDKVPIQEWKAKDTGPAPNTYW
jgi:hypothetical protein